MARCCWSQTHQLLSFKESKRWKSSETTQKDREIGMEIKDAGLDTLAPPDTSNEDEESIRSSCVLSEADGSSGNGLLESSTMSGLWIKVLTWQQGPICQSTGMCSLLTETAWEIQTCDRRQSYWYKFHVSQVCTWMNEINDACHKLGFSWMLGIHSRSHLLLRQ